MIRYDYGELHPLFTGRILDAVMRLAPGRLRAG